MQVTDVRVRRIAKEGKMKAVVSITIDQVFVVHDIKVIEGEKGLLKKNVCAGLIHGLKRNPLIIIMTFFLIFF